MTTIAKIAINNGWELMSIFFFTNLRNHKSSNIPFIFDYSQSQVHYEKITFQRVGIVIDIKFVGKIY